MVDTRSSEETSSSETMEDQKTSSSGMCANSIKQNESPSPVYEQYKKEGIYVDAKDIPLNYLKRLFPCLDPSNIILRYFFDVNFGVFRQRILCRRGVRQSRKRIQQSSETGSGKRGFIQVGVHSEYSPLIKHNNRYFHTSNRAAAFLQLGKEIKAIKDAEQAIALKPDWAKGYFRKGGALVALRRYQDRDVS